ncbi:hypothetical protein LEL_10527 [Akanthomyces lecanii RCEF 1005]|uniref:DNA/RNA-binding domain-containing protein n=1 Tax=Akanthomyces lecanii RCEF 1005 TaxID=1081108 RepID=A0A162MPZ6_CORDF|nr:hypothetical protein LEL_10527 [Akanthomyces lecanii RCEF 1005]
MAEFQKRWVTHLRNNSRQEPSEPNLSCPSCAEDILPDIEAFRAHVRADEPKHPTLTRDADIIEAFRKMAINPPSQRSGSTSSQSANATKQVQGKDFTTSGKGDYQMKSAQREASVSSKHKKARSPSSSLAPASSPPTTPGRSHRRSGVASDFDRGDAAKNVTGRQLWNPPDEPKSRGSRAKASTPRRVRHINRPSSMDQPAVPEVHPADMTTIPDFSFLRQPETRLISKEQLAQEVTGIEEGLELVEAKCMELSVSPEKRIPQSRKLSVEQYQKLIGLHRTLLHEHHDFFLACQHPSANAALRRLPARYNMPARMWRYGIQSFLELLRKRLPDSREHMLTFICIAYSTMTLLYETVPGFVGTWIECLGDLSRYRMAIENDDIRDRETWTSVSRAWYSKASDRSPEVGRLYHHLAILARPDALQQLYYYNKSLCVPAPFPSAWDSIMSLFKPILERKTSLDSSDGENCSGLKREELEDSMAEFLGTLDRNIAERNKDWLHPGYYIAISLICSLLGYGATTNPLKVALLANEKADAPATPALDPAATKNVIDDATAAKTFKTARSFVMQTCDIVFWRKADINCLPFFHTIMVFLYYLAQHPKAMSLVADHVPWKRVADVLNEAYSALMSKPRMANAEFPRPPRNEPLRPLAEDYGMRGLELAKNYFPQDWFSSKKIEDDEKLFEPPSLGDERRQRLLWLGRRMCSLGNWIAWDEGASRFTVKEQFEKDADVPQET